MKPLLISIILLLYWNEISADDFYRPDDSELYKQPDVEITKWSGPYFNEEQQRGAFRNLLRVDGGSRHQRPQAADAAKRTTTDPLSMSDFDPNKLFNPSMIQRPRPRHVKQQGPEAETFIGNEKETSTFDEEMTSPEERLAHLVSKPIFDDTDHDDSTRHSNNRKFVNNNKENENESEEKSNSRRRNRKPEDWHRRRSKDFGHNRSFYDGRKRRTHDEGENHHEEDDDFENQNTEDENRREDGEEDSRKNEIYHHKRHSMFPSSHPNHLRNNNDGGDIEGHVETISSSHENPKELYDQIKRYVKRSKLPTAEIKHHHVKVTKPSRNTKRRQNHVQKHTKRSKLFSPRTALSLDNGNVKKTNTSTSKSNNRTTRNEVTSAGDSLSSSIPGEADASFGTQFSEPYHGTGTHNGNNGYSKGEYFGGDDVADTGDNTPSLVGGGSHEEASFLASDNGASLVKSFVGDDLGGGGGDVMLDSEKLEGFGGGHHSSSYHHGDSRHMMGQHHAPARAEHLPGHHAIASHIMHDGEFNHAISKMVDEHLDSHHDNRHDFGDHLTLHHSHHVDTESFHDNDVEDVGDFGPPSHGILGLESSTEFPITPINHPQHAQHEEHHNMIAPQTHYDVNHLGNDHNDMLASQTNFFEQHHNDGVPGIFGSPSASLTHDEMSAHQYGKHLESVMNHYFPFEAEHNRPVSHHTGVHTPKTHGSHGTTEHVHGLQNGPTRHNLNIDLLHDLSHLQMKPDIHNDPTSLSASSASNHGDDGDDLIDHVAHPNVIGEGHHASLLDGTGLHGSETSFGYFNAHGNHHGADAVTKHRGVAMEHYYDGNHKESESEFSMETLPEYQFEKDEFDHHVPVNSYRGDGHRMKNAEFFQDFIHHGVQEPIHHTNEAAGTALHGAHVEVHHAPGPLHGGAINIGNHHIDLPQGEHLHDHHDPHIIHLQGPPHLHPPPPAAALQESVPHLGPTTQALVNNIKNDHSKLTEAVHQVVVSTQQQKPEGGDLEVPAKIQEVVNNAVDTAIQNKLPSTAPPSAVNPAPLVAAPEAAPPVTDPLTQTGCLDEDPCLGEETSQVPAAEVPGESSTQTGAQIPPKEAANKEPTKTTGSVEPGTTASEPDAEAAKPTTPSDEAIASATEDAPIKTGGKEPGVVAAKPDVVPQSTAETIEPKAAETPLAPKPSVEAGEDATDGEKVAGAAIPPASTVSEAAEDAGVPATASLAEAGTDVTDKINGGMAVTDQVKGAASPTATVAEAATADETSKAVENKDEGAAIPPASTVSEAAEDAGVPATASLAEAGTDVTDKINGGMAVTDQVKGAAAPTATVAEAATADETSKAVENKEEGGAPDLTPTMTQAEAEVAKNKALATGGETATPAGDECKEDDADCRSLSENTKGLSAGNAISSSQFKKVMSAFKVLNAPVPAALQIAELKAEVKEMKDQLNINKQRTNTASTGHTMTTIPAHTKKNKSLLASKISTKTSSNVTPLRLKSPKNVQGVARGKGDDDQAATPNGAAEVTKLISKMGATAVEADPVYAPRFQRLQQLNLHQQQLLKEMLVNTDKVFKSVDKKLKKPDKEQFTVEEILQLGHETDPGVQQAQLVSILRNMQRQAGTAMAGYWEKLKARPPMAFPNLNTFFIKNNAGNAGAKVLPSSTTAEISKSFASKNNLKGVAKSSLKIKSKSKSKNISNTASTKKTPRTSTKKYQQQQRPQVVTHKKPPKENHEGSQKSASSATKKAGGSQQHVVQGAKEDAYADLGSVSISGMIKTKKRSSMTKHV